MYENALKAIENSLQEFTRLWNRWNQLRGLGTVVNSMRNLKQADLKFSLVTAKAAEGLIESGRASKENPIFLDFAFRSYTEGVRFLWVGVHYEKGCMLVSREILFEQMFEASNFQGVEGLLDILLYIYEQDKGTGVDKS